MGEFTTSQFSEPEVNETVRAHGKVEDMWEQQQTWKAIRVNGVRILHAFKRRTKCVGAKPAQRNDPEKYMNNHQRQGPM